MVLHVLKAMSKTVFLIQMVTLYMSGLYYVNVIPFFCCVCVSVLSVFRVLSTSLFFKLRIICNGKTITSSCGGSIWCGGTRMSKLL